ncbi:MAG: IS110 family transposase [Halobacteriota archaeon]|nr:IS110 family transposase [Halobacteriota archaeon]
MALQNEIDIVIANSYQVKQIPGRKTDESDSEWLAKLLRSDLIKPSYMPEKEIRDLRDLTRLRTKIVQTRTDFKNRVHKILERANIRLATVLTDIFGKTGLEILNGLISGRELEELIEGIGNWRIDRERIEEAISGNICECDMFLLEQCMGMIEMLDSEVVKIEKKISERTDTMKSDLEIIMSVPWVGKTAAWEIFAEIGDIDRFSSPKELASWAGLAPSVYQSGCKNLTGRTKKGSKWLRKTMFQVAQCASRSKTSLREFYLRIKLRKGTKWLLQPLQERSLA